MKTEDIRSFKLLLAGSKGILRSPHTTTSSLEDAMCQACFQITFQVIVSLSLDIGILKQHIEEYRDSQSLESLQFLVVSYNGYRYLISTVKLKPFVIA